MGNRTAGSARLVHSSTECRSANGYAARDRLAGQFRGAVPAAHGTGGLHIFAEDCEWTFIAI